MYRKTFSIILTILFFSTLSYACNNGICNLGILSYEPTAGDINIINQYDAYIININVKKTDLDLQISNDVFLYYYRNPNGVHNFTGPDIGYEWNEITQHEDWFLHDSSGNRIQPENNINTYQMDVTNEEWQNFFVNLVLTDFSDRPAYDGLFVDDIRDYDAWYNAYFVWGGDGQYTGQPYPFWTEQEYNNAIVLLLTKLKQALPGKKMMINSQLAPEFMAYADGVMKETFPHDREKQIGIHYTENEWLDIINKVGAENTNGKTIVTVAGFSGTATQEQEDKSRTFSIASYLIARRNNIDTYFFWSGNKQDQSTIGPVENINIGQPTGNYYKNQSIYWRHYINGLVIANPTANHYTVNLGQNFQKTDGTVVSQASLADHEGMVLFKIMATPQSPLILSNIQSSGITNSSATVTWSTDRNANSTLFLGLSQNSVQAYTHDASFVTQHNILLSSLNQNTTYYYKASSCDIQGICNTSGVYAFRTHETQQTQCIDNDHDGYGINCTIGNDCNDNNASINPTSTEICGNNIDEDCDGFDEHCLITCGNGIVDSDETCSTCPLDAACDGTEICIDGICVQPQCITNTDCDDDIQCTQDSCVEFSCYNTQIQNCEPETLKELYVDEPENIIEGAQFTITVLDEKGKSVRYAYISYGSQEKTTNVLGKATFLAESGETTLVIKKFGYMDKTISITSKDLMTKMTEILYEDPLLVGLLGILSAAIIITAVKSKST